MEQLLDLDEVARGSDYQYAFWNTDKPKEPGYSHELVAHKSVEIFGKDNLENLDFEPFPGVDTFYAAIQRNVELTPDKDILGTRVGDEYEWITWRELVHDIEHLSYGIVASGLVPDIEAEGKLWKFMGIQSKNRKEWQYMNLAGMYQGITSVPMYDTLGPRAFKYICN